MRRPHSSVRLAGLCLLAAAFVAALFIRDSRVAAVLISTAGIGWIACCRAAAVAEPGPLLLWTVALGLRLVVFASGPEFSDDIQRYAWEGEVVLEGKSPYAFAPGSPELGYLRERLPELASRVNHPDIAAVYPPLAQAVGIATAVVIHTVGAVPGEASTRILRLFYLLADLGILLVVFRARRQGRLPPAAPVVWGWCPLVCLEFAGSGHLDSLGILFLILALLATDARRAVAPLWAGLGAAVKFVPLCVVPWLGRELPWRKRLLHAAAVPLVLGLGFLPFLLLEGRERGFGSGLHQYGERWEAASFVYRWVERWLHGHSGAGTRFEETRHLARVVMGCIWLAIAGRAMWKRRDAWSGAGALVGAFLVFTPTLHPWYTLWLLPFLMKRPSYAWSFVVAAVALFYWPLDGWKAQAQWVEPVWVWWVVVPTFAALWIGERRFAREPLEAGA